MIYEAMQDFPTIIDNDGGWDQSWLLHHIAQPDAPWRAALQKDGAVAFRGFPLVDGDDFDTFIRATGWPGFTYDESFSNAVRVNVTPRVFTANEAPPDVNIDLHHEMAQTPLYPSKLLFFCEIAADKGGATPICRSDLLFAAMKSQCPDFAAKAADLGVRYTNIMPMDDDAQSGQGRSWRGTLKVADKHCAEARLRALDYRWEWLEADALRVTTAVLPAVHDLGDGSYSFFNQLIAAWKGWADTPGGQPPKIMFGDGSAIADKDMACVAELAHKVTYDHMWQAGDVVILDNLRVMHGRRNFSGKRRVLASLMTG